jgi:hypothetical protein
MRDWRSKQGEDTVGGGLHDGAVVAMDRIDHHLERRIDNRPGLFAQIIVVYLASSPSSALASFKSAVSKPSVNRP